MNPDNVGERHRIFCVANNELVTVEVICILSNWACE